MDIKKLYDIERAVKELQTMYDKRTKPEMIYKTLKSIVDGYASNHCGPSCVNGIARNKGLEEIIKQLNKLQEEVVFQDKYEVVFVKKKK